MSDIAIRVEGLGKQFRLGERRGMYEYRTLRDSMVQAVRTPLRLAQSLMGREGSQRRRGDVFWALDDVNFEIGRGVVVGLIGHNGSGKSTLLKILSRITEPSRGRAIVYGRVGSLLEVGTGFHAELTGRENTYLYGAILGMKRTEIERKFDEIVAFAEVENFIDTAVKHYSSGMYLRLAFAVAAHLEPEILMVDEVLAVGDAAFQRKCLGKMSEVARGGRTVLFVSHNMAAVESLCQQGIVLKHGRVDFTGTQTEAIRAYLESYSPNTTSLVERTDRQGTGEIQITSISFRDMDGRPVANARSGQPVDICLHFRTTARFDNPRLQVAINLKTPLDVPVFMHHNLLTGEEFGSLPETGMFAFRLDRLPLSASSYRISYRLSIAHNRVIDTMEHAAELHVIEGDFFGHGETLNARDSAVLINGHWRMSTE